MFKAFEGAQRKTKEDFDALPIPYIVKRIIFAGHSMEKLNSNAIVAKANESTQHAKKRNFTSFLERFHNDDLHRHSQIAMGRTEEHCKYLDSLVLIGFSCTAARKERQRYENNYTLGINGQGPKPRPMKKRADCLQAVNKVLAVRKQVENPNPYVPRDGRFRQRPIEKGQRMEEQWRQWRWISWSEPSSSSSTTWWPASTEMPAWWSSEEWQERKLVFSPARCFAYSSRGRTAVSATKHKAGSRECSSVTKTAQR